MDELQGLVDALANTLDRPIAVDDRQFRVLVYSSHLDAVDPVRVASILHREAPKEAVAWLESLGVRDVEGYLRVSANPRLGMAARICVPVRFDGTLLGYLWLIDEPKLVSGEELETVLHAADHLGVALYRVRRLEHEHRVRERDLLRQLLEEDEPDRAKEAARALVDNSFLAAASCYTVLALRAMHPSGREAPDDVRIRLAAAVDQVRRTVPPRHLIMLVAGEEVIAMHAFDAAREADQCASELAQAVERNLVECPGWLGLVGVGGSRSSLCELGGSYRQARQALELATKVEELRPLVRWNELGAYRTLAGLTNGHDPAPLIPEQVLRLVACADADTLVLTLETYLDRAGDARATANALFLHRSSLYGRLRRIEEVARVDLRNGEDRLELHLGLRLRRISQASLPTPSPTAVEPSARATGRLAIGSLAQSG